MSVNCTDAIRATASVADIVKDKSAKSTNIRRNAVRLTNKPFQQSLLSEKSMALDPLCLNDHNLAYPVENVGATVEGSRRDWTLILQATRMQRLVQRQCRKQHSAKAHKKLWEAQKAHWEQTKHPKRP